MSIASRSTGGTFVHSNFSSVTICGCFYNHSSPLNFNSHSIGCQTQLLSNTSPARTSANDENECPWYRVNILKTRTPC
jgi:hypothetical protein